MSQLIVYYVQENQTIYACIMFYPPIKQSEALSQD